MVGVPDWAIRMPPVHFDGAGEPNCRCFIDNNGVWNVIVDERTCPWCPILSRAWNTAIATVAAATTISVPGVVAPATVVTPVQPTPGVPGLPVPIVPTEDEDDED